MKSISPGREKVKRYFRENAGQWVRDGYQSDGYDYPLAFHRLRLIMKILGKTKKVLQIADLGCGGGDVSFALAAKGHHVWGVDESPEMITLAQKRSRVCLSKRAASRCHFLESHIQDSTLPTGFFDVVIAMGVIGYFPKDQILLNEAARLLKPGGMLLLSCRNRLFNLFSLTDKTRTEIKSGQAFKLMGEIDALYSAIPLTVASEYVTRSKKAVGQAAAIRISKGESASFEVKNQSKDYTMQMEARQHTPSEIQKNAKSAGFTLDKFYGVHPHFISPKINHYLPSGLYNAISDTLLAFEDLPVSLIWSSAFICVFQKNEAGKN